MVFIQYICLVKQSKRKSPINVYKRWERNKRKIHRTHLVFVSYSFFFESVMMMKAAVVTSFTEPLEIKQVPIPQVGPNDILVKNISCGVCHSDLHLAKGGNK